MIEEHLLSVDGIRSQMNAIICLGFFHLVLYLFILRCVFAGGSFILVTAFTGLDWMASPERWLLAKREEIWTQEAFIMIDKENRTRFFFFLSSYGVESTSIHSVGDLGSGKKDSF